jgi:hypothetical protein
MGMFDDLKCLYPLPVEGANDLTFQTKDLVCWLDNYEIRADGTLWHEEYDTEDQSDPTAKGLLKFLGAMARVNKRWVPVLMTGEVMFYSALGEDHKGWIEFSAYFVGGKLKELHQLHNRYPNGTES